jgi:hypothetical protein
LFSSQFPDADQVRKGRRSVRFIIVSVTPLMLGVAVVCITAVVVVVIGLLALLV